MANFQATPLSNICLPLQVGECGVVYDTLMNPIHKVQASINDLMLGKIKTSELDILQRLMELKQETSDLQLEIITTLTIDPMLLTMCRPDPAGYAGEEMPEELKQRLLEAVKVTQQL